MEYDPNDFEKKLKACDPVDTRILYEQYSEWSRHLHSEVLTIATFGITVSLGSYSLATNLAIPIEQFIAIGIANLFLLLVCHLFIESIKNQQANFWAIIDNIESYWKIRDINEIKDRPLIVSSKKYKPGATGKQRRNLYIVCGIVWIVTITIKLYFHFL